MTALTYMTLNLLCEEAVNRAGTWRERRPLVEEAIRSHSPDVLGVQEASERQIEQLLEMMPDHCVVTGPESGAARLPRRFQTSLSNRGEHCAIFYRQDRFQLLEHGAFWLSRAPAVPGSVLPGTWLPRVVNWVRLQGPSGHRVTVFNAHFDFLPWAPTISAHILRERMDAAWDGSHQVILGDFNATHFSRAFHHLQKSGATVPPFHDAWLAARSRHGPSRTYHAGTGRGRWHGRLDRILFRPEARIEHAFTETIHRGDVYPSDHFPVIAELHL